MTTANLYTARRTEIFADPKYKLLAEVFGSSFNDRTRAALQKVPHRPPHDIYQIEQLLSDISNLLDRCLVYQRQYEELDTAATKSVFDDKLFLDQISSLKIIELAESIEKQRQAERAQQAIAAGKFHGVSGQRWFALAGVAGNDEAIKGEKERKNAVRQKWVFLEQYMTEFRDRHSAPGNSFNWSERVNRVLRFYLADISEAYQKARAVHKSLEAVCGIITVLPNLVSSQDILSDLVLWNRDAIDKFELFREADSEFEMTVYVRQPNASGSALMTDGEFDKIMGGPGEFTLDLSSYLAAAPTLQHLRVRGIGLSISMTGNLGTDLQRMKLYRLSAVVFPPNVPDLFGAPMLGKPIARLPRRPSVISNVSITDPTSPVRYVSGTNINNIDPRGRWRIKVSKTVGYPDTQRRERPSEITDIKLHLLLAGQLSPDEGDWKNLLF